MNKFLEKHLKIYSHETSRFIWISAIFFVIFFVIAMWRNYIDTAFLKRYGPNSIPIMLVINAILTFMIMGVIDRLGRRFSDSLLLGWCLAIYAAASISLFFAVKMGSTLAYPILYQLLYLLDSILLVYLWNIAGDLFDARQGKRLFPLITAAQVLGTTIGSFLTRPFTAITGEDSTLLLFGIVCIGVAIFIWRTSYGHTGPVAGNVAEKTGMRAVKLIDVPSLMKKYPIIRYLIITGLIPNVLLPIFFYQFSLIANHTFATEQSLISFLSVFRGTTTLMTFVLLFFMGRIYTSIGIANSSLIQPINFSIIFGLLSASFSIYPACYGQFTTILIQRAIAGPVNKILYNIIPSDLVTWSRTFIRGTVLKVGMLAGSLAMIALKPIMAAKYFSILGIALAVYWTIETLFFRRYYTRILKQVIVEKQIDFDQLEAVGPFEGVGAAMELGPVSVQERLKESQPRTQSEMPPDTALALLGDTNAGARAEAAASFAFSKDIRAVVKLIRLLEDPDDDVRKSAIDSLTAYGEKIQPFLELSLLESRPRAKQGILEVIRLSGVKNFEIIPFLGKELHKAYSNLIAYRELEGLDDNQSAEMLRRHLIEVNEETLSLIFYALWVNHADMRLMYQALKSETASIAVELIENSIQKELSPYLIPLIEDIPINEKIERGRKFFPLVRNSTPERLLTLLAGADDPLTRMLALYVIGDHKLGESFSPIIEVSLTDGFDYVREIADYALKRNNDEVIPMPDIIEKINTLKSFTIFEGMGIRELHAIASVVSIEYFEPEQVMIREGEENSSIYLIVGGKVAIYGNYGVEGETKKAEIGKGGFLGELSLFTRLPPNATCVAAQETMAYVLRHHQFQEIMKVYPQIGINLCRFFTMKLRQVRY